MTYDPGGHFIAGVTFFLSTSLAMLALSRRLAKDRSSAPKVEEPRRQRSVECWFSSGSSCWVAARSPDAAPLHNSRVWRQRPWCLLLVTFPCLVALAIRLYNKKK